MPMDKQLYGMLFLLESNRGSRWRFQVSHLKVVDGEDGFGGVGRASAIP